MDSLSSRYALERELGRGGMATVYLAKDLKHAREVAVKVIRSDLAAAVGPDRFLREIQITAGLNHPHLLPLLDSGALDGFLYYVMPYVGGGSLRRLLESDATIPLEAVLRIVGEVASALDYAHDRGVVHRDIKPENFLLYKSDDDTHIKLIDFGLAKRVVPNEIMNKPNGTPYYIAPEVLKGSYTT